MPPVTKNLLIINVLVWLAMVIMPVGFDRAVTRSCALHYFLSPDFKPWQLLTYMFMHATRGIFMTQQSIDISHLFFNMFGLVMFGSVLEHVFGSKRYLFFYLTVGIGAALIQEGVYAIWIHNLASGLPEGWTLSTVVEPNPQFIKENLQDITPEMVKICEKIYDLINTPTVGASGALYGILLGFAMLFPNMPLYFFFIPVPIKAKWMVLGYGVIELFFGVTGLQSGVAHFAHLGGMLVALLLILYWRKNGEINRGPLY